MLSQFEIHSSFFSVLDFLKPSLSSLSHCSFFDTFLCFLDSSMSILFGFAIRYFPSGSDGVELCLFQRSCIKVSPSGSGRWCTPAFIDGRACSSAGYCASIRTSMKFQNKFELHSCTPARTDARFQKGAHSRTNAEERALMHARELVHAIVQ